MPTLHVRDVPERLYSQLKRQARVEGRSLTEHVKSLLADAVLRNRRTQAQILASIQARRAHYNPTASAAPDSIELIREDRNR